MILFGFSREVCDILVPRTFEPTAEWACRNVFLPPGSEIKGPFRLDLFPHSREPLECFDDPAIQIITLQWGSRVGKTVLLQAVLAKTAATKPNPMAWGDADQKSVERVFRRLWKILAKVPALEDRCPPPHVRSASRIEFPDFLIHGAWSGSASSAADYAAYVVVKNEVDKMTKRKSDEADFFKLMDERAKGFLGSKILNASTPSYRGRSRIESARLAGDNRRREVPCLRCGHWQTLRTGDGKKPGGIRWEKLPNGRSDPQLAYETAWYECEACGGKLLNHERQELLNAGQWVREGESVVGSGRIVGTPIRPGSHASFGPLGTCYSLLPSIHWGTIAREFLQSRQSIQARRNYHNSWEALTWDDTPTKLEYSELAERLCGDFHRGVCPDWAVFLTRGVDIKADGHTYWWVVCAWGIGGRCALIDWGWTGAEGEQSGDERFRHELVTRCYPHADGGPALRPALTLIDSGDGEHTDEVYAFCRTCPGTLPCKGSHTSAFNTAFRLSDLTGDNARQRDLKARLGGLVLVEVNTERSEWWLENNLRADGDIDPTGPHGILLPLEAAVDFVLLDQLTNEYPDELRNERGYDVHTWKKRPGHAIEWRDAARYAWVAAQWQTNHGQYWHAITRKPPVVVPAVSKPALTTPDGRPFLVTERR
jgi:phage terminase large subunit GpA-like protein